MLTGSNALAMRGTKSKVSELKEKLQELKVNFWNDYKEQIDNTGEFKGDIVKFEKEVEKMEYKIWCEEYEDNRRRNWK
jgi:hypothetical protein